MDRLTSIMPYQTSSTSTFKIEEKFTMYTQLTQMTSLRILKNSRISNQPNTPNKNIQTPLTCQYGSVTPQKQPKNDFTPISCQKIKLNFFQENHVQLSQEEEQKSEIKFKVIKKAPNELKLDRFGKKIYSFKHIKQERIMREITKRID